MSVRYNPNLHHRRSIRLSTFDYAQAGAYFITICTHQRLPLLTDRLVRGVVSSGWHGLERRFARVRLDQFVIMPNHIHGIIWNAKKDPRVGAQLRAWPTDRPLPYDISNRQAQPLLHHAAPLRPFAVQPRSLGTIVRAFKSVTTKRINRLRATPGAAFWQRNYYERVIRNEDELNRIRQYIIDNPANWAEDENNPANWP